MLLSGGIDSAVALYWGRSQGWTVATLEFEYFQRPARERQSCRELRLAANLTDAAALAVPFLRETVDLEPGQIRNPGLAEAPEGYIPARNLVFYALAAARAENGGFRYVVGGHNRGDAANFPDASREFFARLNHILPLALWSYESIRTEIILPLINMDKGEVVRLGAALGVPFVSTWSCYGDGAAHCGACRSCAERHAAFSVAGIDDPLEV